MFTLTLCQLFKELQKMVSNGKCVVKQYKNYFTINIRQIGM